MLKIRGPPVLGEATPNTPQTAYEIVGMVRDSKYQTLREDDQPIMYLCLPQESAGNIGRILIRSALDLDRVAASVRTALQEIHPEIRFRFQFSRHRFAIRFCANGWSRRFPDSSERWRRCSRPPDCTA
jgi:hypothetical protein